ncbi:MAG: hypothetical protein KKE23_04080 [Nanoarchaeota archaeon]|nr:hypothetical protein [Nanoarchaeota archaeon]
MQKIGLISFSQLLSILLIFAALPLAAAQQAAAEDPGMTPDNFLWGLDNAFDQLSLLFATNPDAKAAKGLEIASERLSEIKLMVKENKLQAIARAEEAHGKVLIKVKESIKNLEKANATEEIENLIEIERELKDHEEDVLELKLKIKIEVEGQLSTEQQALLNNFMASLLSSTGEVKVEIKTKKGETKIKIMSQTGKNEDEIDYEIEKIEKEEGGFEEETKVKVEGDVTLSPEAQETLNKLVASLENATGKVELKLKVKKEIVSNAINNATNEARTFISKEEVNVEGTNLTSEQKTLWDLLKNQSLALVSVAAGNDLELEIEIEHELDVEEERGRDEEELEIEVDIEDGMAEVKIELNGEDLDFTLNTTDQELILQEIALRLDVTVDSIRPIVEFEVEEDEEQADENGDEDEMDENGQEDKDENNEGKELECSADANCDADEVCINNECEDKEKVNSTA